MNLALPEIYHFSEDYSILEDEEARPTKVEFFQYESKDFDFWTKDRVDRSINRYMSSDAERRAPKECGLHPMELERPIQAPMNKAMSKVLDFPDVFQARLIGEKSVNTLQEWECVVEDLDDDMVIASGLSLIDSSPEQNVLQIPLREFADKDKALIGPGVVFRLIIGYAKKPSGQRIRESICYVRRTVASHCADLEGIANL